MANCAVFVALATVSLATASSAAETLLAAASAQASTGALAASAASVGSDLSTSSLLRSVATASAARDGVVEQQNKAGASTIHVGPPSDVEKMNFLLKTVQRYKKLALDGRQSAHARHDLEAKRLQASIESTRDEGTKAALIKTKELGARALSDTDKVFNNIQSFGHSVEEVLSAASQTGGCDSQQCGEFATCTDTSVGAQCVCNEGYVGTGHNCQAPPEFAPRRILYEGKGGMSTHAADVDVNVFAVNKIAIVFRDTSRGDIGRIVLGSVREAGMADLSPPEQFTAPFEKAFSPVVAGTDGGNVAVAWRDQNRAGAGWIRAASLGGTGIRGADMAMTWGEQVNVCGNHQAHKMALVALNNDHVALMLSDKTMATAHAPQESYGTAVLAKLTALGGLSISKQRFFDYPVCRLEVTKISPTAFVVGARAGKAVDDMDASVVAQQQAVGILGELSGQDLVFGASPVNLEPSAGQVWARGLSLIAPNTVAYAYQDGVNLTMKMAVIQVDLANHGMQIVQNPVQFREGFSPYVSMLSVPYHPSYPHTLTYFESGDKSRVNICSWDVQQKQLSKCQDFTWLPQKLTSVAGVHLGGGKSFMVFTTDSGTPYYSVFGLSMK